MTGEIGVSGPPTPETILSFRPVLMAIVSRITLTPMRWISILCIFQVAVPAGHKRERIRGEIDEGAGVFPRTLPEFEHRSL